MSTSGWVECVNVNIVKKDFSGGYLHLSNPGMYMNLVGEFRISEDGKLSFRKNSCFYFAETADHHVLYTEFLSNLEKTRYHLCSVDNFEKVREISREEYKEMIFSKLEKATETFIEKFKNEKCPPSFEIYTLDRPAEKEDLDNSYVFIRESSFDVLDKWRLRCITIDTGYDGIMLNNLRESNSYDEVEVCKSITLEEAQHWLEFYKNQCKERIKLLLQQIP